MCFGAVGWVLYLSHWPFAPWLVQQRGTGAINELSHTWCVEPRLKEPGRAAVTLIKDKYTHVLCLTGDSWEKCLEWSEAVRLMHINYFALRSHVDVLTHFLEETSVKFYIEVEELSSSKIKSLLNSSTCVQILEMSYFYLCLHYLNVLQEHIVLFFFFFPNLLKGCIQDQGDFFMDTNIYYGQVYLVEIDNLF